jgi:hypothetical protein
VWLVLILCFPPYVPVAESDERVIIFILSSMKLISYGLFVFETELEGAAIKVESCFFFDM